MMNGNGGPIDSGKYTMPLNLYNASSVDSFAVTPSDTTAGAEPVTYSFTVKPRSKVAKGAYLVVQLPPEINVADVSEMSRGCQS
jgi:hypothetical protein